MWGSKAAGAVLGGMCAALVAGCGALTSLPSTPTVTPVASHAGEITPTATISPATPDSSTPSQTPSPSSDPNVGARADEQVVSVDNAGIAFAAPLLMERMDPATVLSLGQDSGPMKRLAARLGVSTAQLKNGLLNRTDTMLFGGGEIMVMHQTGALLPDDRVFRRQFEIGSGGTVSRLTHLTTKAGPTLRLVYTLVAGGTTIHGEALAVSTGTTLVSVTVLGPTATHAAALTDRVVATLRQLG